MPIGKLNEEDRRRLSDHFWAIVLRACAKHDCWAGEVLNRLKKSHGVKGISPARAEIVEEMRGTAFTYYSGDGQCRLWLRGESVLPAVPIGKLNPVSFPLLGRMLGCDHSALVLAQQKVKKSEEIDREAQIRRR